MAKISDYISRHWPSVNRSRLKCGYFPRVEGPGKHNPEHWSPFFSLGDYIYPADYVNYFDDPQGAWQKAWEAFIPVLNAAEARAKINDPERDRLNLYYTFLNLCNNFAADFYSELSEEAKVQKAKEFIEVFARIRSADVYLPQGKLNLAINKLVPILKSQDTTLTGTNEEIFWATVGKKQAELLAASNREEINNVVENEG